MSLSCLYIGVPPIHQPLSAQQSEKGAFIMPRHTYTPEVIRELIEVAEYYGANIDVYRDYLDDVENYPPLDVTEAWNSAAADFNRNLSTKNENGALDAYQKLEIIHSEWPKHFDKNRAFLDEAHIHISNIKRINDLRSR